LNLLADNIRAQKSVPSKAAAAGSMFSSGNNAGAAMVGQYYSYQDGDSSTKMQLACADGESSARPYGISA
jgi:hypothetical protein